jgi:hypothetical protein
MTDKMKRAKHEERERKEVEKWDPDNAKAQGCLKGCAEFKTELDYDTPAIEFSEPKSKKKIKTTVKTTVIKGRGNKNALF